MKPQFLSEAHETEFMKSNGVLPCSV